MRGIAFRKTGKEIKAAVANRRRELEERLAPRNRALDEFLRHPDKVRSYLLRGNQGFGHGERSSVLYGKDHISSEDREEMDQLCQRIFEIEHELQRLAYFVAHLDDQETFELSLGELIEYGFEPNT